MGTLITDRTVGDWVVERPARAAVFERLGIDYCCGGKLPLRQVCERRGLDMEAVLRELNVCESRGEGEENRDWSKASLSDLTEHIVSAHHGYLREALPRLAVLSAKVASAHGERHEELATLQHVVDALKAELEEHMAKEEVVLFPMCRALETAEARPAFHCGSVSNPIRVMSFEHEDAGRALEAIRELTHDFTPPADACNTYRALLDGLAELERDMHRHVHEENNILFPRAVAAETALPAPGKV